MSYVLLTTGKIATRRPVFLCLTHPAFVQHIPTKNPILTMSNQLQSNQTTKATVRVDKDLLEAFDESLGDTSRSEAIRSHMRDVAGSYTGDYEEPESDRLAAAYEALLRSADPQGIISAEVAKSRIAEATRVPRADCGRAVLDPLSEKGYITVVQWGKIRCNVGADL